MSHLWWVARALERTAGAAALAGACAFFGFWVLAVFDAADDIPWVLSGAWHGLTIALLAIGFIGLQLNRGDRRVPWLAWTGVVLIVIGLVTVVEALIAGFVVFGVALTVGGRRERLPGLLLTLGGVTFLATLSTSAPFWGEGSPQPEGGPLRAYTASLTLIALGIAATGLVETRAWTAQVRGTGSTAPS